MTVARRQQISVFELSSVVANLEAARAQQVGENSLLRAENSLIRVENNLIREQ